ncbi:MAG: pyridoxal-phosphate dependent enzyme, partial [Candidatus Bathyarchaeia archaeon]|nr:pyridoxal-phosphate dependent enzyme [Candidatus Bathyarchaeota archaeon]
ANLIKRGFGDIEFVNRPETIATAIRIGSPVNWKKAVRAIKESGGMAETVSDDEILEAQRLLAKYEGIFVEPAGAASAAGLMRLAREGLIGRDELVVCVATGHGLKDPDIVLRQFPKPVEIEADIKALVDILLSEN